MQNVFLAFIFLVGVVVPCTAQDSQNEKVLLGYAYGVPADINYKLYTHLCHAFVVAEKNGDLIPNKDVPNREFASEAHKAGVKVLLSLGGWGWDENFAEMSLDQAAEDNYVQNVMKLVEEFDYDGIDLDWEYPDTNIEIVGFERLSRKFRKKLDELAIRKQRKMLLTMAASADPKTLGWLDNEFLLEVMDWINVMTYDYYGSWSTHAGHHSPLFSSSRMPPNGKLSSEASIKYMLGRKFPADRIALGIPLYGRAFAVAEQYAEISNSPKPKRESWNFKDIAELLKNADWKRSWDDETKSPWLIANDGSEIVGYDDAESVAIKTKWAFDRGLRGVFFWQVDADRMPDGTNPLQETSSKIMLQGR